MRKRERIGLQTLKAANPDPDRDYVITDKDLSGFRLRVRTTGRRTYELRYYFGQRERLYVIGDHGSPWTPDEARQKAQSLLRQVELGVDPQAARRAGRQAETVRELIDRYLADGPADKPMKRASSWNTDRINFERHVAPLLGTTCARDLTASDLSKWQKDVADGKSARKQKTDKKRGVSNVRGGRGVAARAMRSLSAMLSWAVSKHILDDNPARRVAKLTDGTRERFLSPAEAVQLWGAINELEAANELRADFADVFRLLALTGARRGEILGLKWSEVDFARGMLVLPPDRHKAGAGGRGRTIRINQVAVDILQSRMDARPVPATKGEKPVAWVFPKGDGSGPIEPPKRAWAIVRAHAKMPDLRLHDLRHTFASLLIAEGVPLAIVGKALGHTKAATTERYAHLRDDATRLGADHVGSVYSLTAMDRPARPN